MTNSEISEIADMLLSLQKLKGDNAFQNKRVVLSALSDMLPDVEKRTATLLSVAMDCDAFTIMAAAESSDLAACVFTVADKMRDDYGSDREASLDIAKAIAIFYQKSRAADGQDAQLDEVTPEISALRRRESRSSIDARLLEQAQDSLIGGEYSAYPPKPMLMCEWYDDLVSQFKLDASDYSLTHPLQYASVLMKAKNLRRLAEKCDEAFEYLHVYDAYVLDGGEQLPEAQEFKKYDESYYITLKWKFEG